MLAQGNLLGFRGEALPVREFTQLPGKQLHTRLIGFCVALVQIPEVLLCRFEELFGFFQLFGLQSLLQLPDFGLEASRQSFLLLLVNSGLCRFLAFAGQLPQWLQ